MNKTLLEYKIFISYIVVCLTYSLCRLHYLITIKSDEEFNSMLEQLQDISGDKDVIKSLVILQALLSPITAPFSMIKQIYKLISNCICKKN